MHVNGPINAVTTASGCKRAMIRSRASLSQEIVLIGESYVANHWRVTAGGDTLPRGSAGPATRLDRRASRSHDRVNSPCDSCVTYCGCCSCALLDAAHVTRDAALYCPDFHPIKSPN